VINSDGLAAKSRERRRGNGEEGAVLLIGVGRASKRAGIEWNLTGE
jgi:hypothetical protein